MADRIFCFITFALVLAYGYLAFFVIKAPFQYDPLGPETWPQILAACTALCTIGLFFRPDVFRMGVEGATWIRIIIVLILLSAYAYLFEPLGFIISTTIFSTVFALLLGAERKKAALFGLSLGVLGYLVCAKLLGLNLPDGLLSSVL